MLRNKVDNLIKLIQSKPGLRSDERIKFTEKLEQLKLYMCCLPKCEQFEIEFRDQDNNFIKRRAFDVCVDDEWEIDSCFNLMLVDFAADETIQDKETDITFTDLSTNNPTSWYWDFGDGNTSTDQNPVHQYDDYGYYTVTLMAANEDAGAVTVKEDYITIVDPSAL